MEIKMNKNTYAVFTQQNVNGNNPPHKNCKIRKILEKVAGETVVFHGSLDECEEYVKENCRMKI